MAIQTPQAYRDEITLICESIIEHYNSYCREIPALEALGVILPSYTDTLAEALIQGVNTYARDVCKQISKANQGETTRTFTSGELKFTGLELPITLDPYRCTNIEPRTAQYTLDAILDNFDFDKFVSELTRHANSLESFGKADIAEALSSNFSLKASYRDGIITRTSRHFTFSNKHQAGWHGKYDYHMAERIHRLKVNVTAVAKEMGVPALLSSYTELADAMLSGNKLIESGTSFGNANTVQIKVFKGHIRHSLTPEMMDAIVTYIRMYAPDIELCELPQAA